MPSGPEHGVPWDEGAALEELERLKRGIEEWRRRRKDVQADFDRFVRGFRTPPSGREIGAEISDTPAADTVLAAPSAPLPSAVIPTTNASEPAVVLSEPAPLPTAPSLPPIVAAPVKSRTLSAAQRKRRTQVIVATGVGAVVLAVGALLTLPWNGRPDGAPGTGSKPATARATQVPRPTAPSDARPNPVVSEAPRSEIAALKRVWVRIVVDGTREVERELNAGDRVPLRAGRTSVIRAGNAGAVRLTINGEDRGLLGPEGEVVTRTLQIPAPPDR